MIEETDESDDKGNEIIMPDMMVCVEHEELTREKLNQMLRCVEESELEKKDNRGQSDRKRTSERFCAAPDE